MIYLLEGVDCSGKSTLAKKLQKTFGGEIVHVVQPKTLAEQDRVPFYKDLIDSHDNLILDRGWYSDLVYGEFYRKQADIEWSEIYEIEIYLKKKGCMIIHCTDTAEALWDRVLERGDDTIKSYSELSNLKRRFSVALKHSVLPVVEHYVGISRF